MTTPLIELSGITKSFPGVKSLDAVTFSALPGEVHALLGENGAGKSTLIKTIAGAYSPDAGTIRFDGQPRHWSGPAEAKAAGIHVIYQELVLFPELSVAENIVIGQEPRTRWGLIDRGRMVQDAQAILTRLGHALDPLAPVKSLSVADQQMVEIAKALVGDARLLVLDEPTAVISGHEAELLFERVRRLRDQGVCVIYISHRLEEIFALADRVTVLKDGKVAGTRAVSDIDRDRLVAMMVGRPLSDLFPPKRGATEASGPVLSVRDLAAAPRVRGVSFDLQPGEILGLAGLVGSGRSETAHAIFGSLPRTGGEVELAGAPLAGGDPSQSIARGLGLLTEDRKGEGLLMNLEMSANVTAPTLAAFQRGPFVSRTAERSAARQEIARFRIAVPGPAAGVKALSGGNQQKILFARWARACHRVLILDEPTRGVDVGAKVEIYRIIHELAAAGAGILVISSELPEVIGLASRVLVMREGRIAGELTGDAIDERSIMRLAALGGLPDAA
ncbi:MAG: sugar ABC transporter ATP-binding protein [Alsobacter sp.]